MAPRGAGGPKAMHASGETLTVETTLPMPIYSDRQRSKARCGSSGTSPRLAGSRCGSRNGSSPSPFGRLLNTLDGRPV
jgi:hypothetical protein